jgi:hypothetical protein
MNVHSSHEDGKLNETVRPVARLQDDSEADPPLVRMF